MTTATADPSLYYGEAVQAASELGWNPDTVYRQWQVETGDFTSPVFLADNNFAGMKYGATSPGATPGSAAPSNEGPAPYAHYDSQTAGVQGYVNWVKANPAYANVSSTQDAYQEAVLLQNDGWAGHGNTTYANTLFPGGKSGTPPGNSGGTGQGATTTAAQDASSGTTQALNSLNSAMHMSGGSILNPGPWIEGAALRMFFVLIGLVLIIVALVKIVGADNIKNAAMAAM